MYIHIIYIDRRRLFCGLRRHFSECGPTPSISLHWISNVLTVRVVCLCVRVLVCVWLRLGVTRGRDSSVDVSVEEKPNPKLNPKLQTQP